MRNKAAHSADLLHLVSQASLPLLGKRAPTASGVLARIGSRPLVTSSDSMSSSRILFAVLLTGCIPAIQSDCSSAVKFCDRESFTVVNASHPNVDCCKLLALKDCLERRAKPKCNSTQKADIDGWKNTTNVADLLLQMQTLTGTELLGVAVNSTQSIPDPMEINDPEVMIFDETIPLEEEGAGDNEAATPEPETAKSPETKAATQCPPAEWHMEGRKLPETCDEAVSMHNVTMVAEGKDDGPSRMTIFMMGVGVVAVIIVVILLCTCCCVMKNKCCCK